MFISLVSKKKVEIVKNVMKIKMATTFLAFELTKFIWKWCEK